MQTGRLRRGMRAKRKDGSGREAQHARKKPTTLHATGKKEGKKKENRKNAARSSPLCLSHKTVIKPLAIDRLSTHGASYVLQEWTRVVVVC